MIDVGATRDLLVTAAVGGDPDVAAYPRAVDSVASFPAVVIGQPSWQPGPTFCLDRWEFPVAVIVSRPGISDEDTVAQLDGLWPQVLDRLKTTDLPLEGSVDRAQFGLFRIQGQDYPAQVITVTVTG